MNELSLFSGAGGGLLGTKLLGWTTVGYVENSDYCQRVLAQRIKDGILDQAPIFGDVRAFIDGRYAAAYKGLVDVVTAGFPCQPFSVAGRRKGADDERNMWPQTIECIRQIKPRYFFGENVPGLLNSGYFPEILGSLAEIGFDAKWTVLGANDVGAPHRRKRLWILAYPNGQSRSSRQPRRAGGELPTESEGLRGRESKGQTGQESGGSSSDVAYPNSGRRWSERFREGVEGIQGGRQNDRSTSAESGDVAYPDGPRLQGRVPDGIIDTEGREEQGDRRPPECGTGREGFGNSVWPTEPDVGRVANGVASRVDRLKAIGNGQVPLVAATAWKLLNG